jgi:hypothetical protein
VQVPLRTDVPESSSASNIERCNSVAQGAEIEALFRRNEHPKFAAAFERAYPYAYSNGGASWIARDDEGTAVGHLAVFPRMFRDGSRTVRGALLADCLFDRAHRNFFLAVQLCRRVVADLRLSGRFDFAYSDPTPPAVPVLKAAGFAPLGALQRLVTPTHPLYVGLCALRARAERLTVERVGDRYEQGIAQAVDRMCGAEFRAARSPELYATRLGGADLLGCEWLVVRSRLGSAAPEVALVLVARQSGSRLLNIADVRWDDRRVSPASTLVAVARSAWAGGCPRLGIVTLVPSGFADTLTRCGFIRRRDALPLLTLTLGETPLPPPERWLLTFFDGSGW